MSAITSEPVAVHGLRFDVAALSEQGPRSDNQDAFSIDTFAATGMVALADGMGGERSGRVAADTALEAVLRAAPLRSVDDARRAVRAADTMVTRAARQDPETRQGMGCALGLLCLATNGDGTGWIGAHVGDVRILSRAPDGLLRLETRDHTPAFARWEAGEISLDEIPDTAGANRLQRAVGRGGEADVVWLPARAGWSWLLISDGVYKAVRLDELASFLDAPSAAAAVETIGRKVAERGPDDNYTVVLLRALDDDRAFMTSDDTLHMSRSNSRTDPVHTRSRAGIVAIILAIVALAVAALAAWGAWTLRETAASTATADSLRIEIDSLRAEVVRLREPFGPSPSPPRSDSTGVGNNGALP